MNKMISSSNVDTKKRFAKKKVRGSKARLALHIADMIQPDSIQALADRSS
ncbi:hypothetical protein OU994_01895 [Pseudoduganella sp. SL102]|nr:hypothetical protein [Pseudoduganella sp. SL102]WBS03088.1 hypothetical protein OU994_01895 [Pseudoduganella sp. SL102]